MATVYGVNRTLANNPAGSNITDPGVLEGKLRVMMDSYEAASLASGSIIEVGRELPKNARIINVILMTDALGAGRTLAVGDYEDNDRYITATTCNTANLVTYLNAIDGRLYEVDETYTGKTVGSGTDRQITVTLGGGSAATGTIKIAIIYTYE